MLDENQTKVIHSFTGLRQVSHLISHGGVAFRVFDTSNVDTVQQQTNDAVPLGRFSPLPKLIPIASYYKGLLLKHGGEIKFGHELALQQFQHDE